MSPAHWDDVVRRPAEQASPSRENTTTAVQDTVPPPWVALLLDGLATAVRDTRPGGQPVPAEEPVAAPKPPPKPKYATLEGWVDDYLAQIIVRRDDAGFRWCPSWWAHSEVVSRLMGLWRAWEQARASKDPIQLNTWWKEHLDHHLPVITAPDGPFGMCSQDKGHVGDAPGLTVVPVPPGHFKPA